MSISTQLRSVAHLLTDRQLRSFGCECCLRLLPRFNDPILRELISYGQVRSVRPMQPEELKAMHNRSLPYYDLLYPGYGPASALVHALSAGGFVAYTDIALEAAAGAAVTAADAFAVKAADGAPDGRYDAVFKSVKQAEQKRQMEILRKYLPSDYELK